MLLLYHSAPVAMRRSLECRTCRIIYTNMFLAFLTPLQ
jgi:hypothetical protein